MTDEKQRSSSIGLKRLMDSPMSREFVVFSTTTLLSQGTRFGISIFAAKTLGPSIWGIWQLLYLILAYSSLSHLGITNAMNREVPLLSGKGEMQKVREVEAVTMGSVLIASLIAGSLLLFVSFFASGSVPTSSMLCMVFLFVSYTTYNYFEVYLRANGLFFEMSRQQLFFSLMFILLVTPAIVIFKFEGFLLSQAVVIMLTVAFIIKTLPVIIKPVFDFTTAFRLIKIGFPIMIGMILFTFMNTADRWMIATWLNLEQLGYYSLAIMVLRALMVVPTVIAQQIFPNMAQSWGKTNSCKDLKKWIRLHCFMCLGLLVPLSTLVWWLMPIFVSRFMPDFVPGIAAMKISLAMPLFFGLSTAYVNLLNTVDQQFKVMLIRGVALICNLLLNSIFLHFGLGINGVALGTVLSFGLYYLSVLTLGRHVIRKLEKPCGLHKVAHIT